MATIRLTSPSKPTVINRFHAKTKKDGVMWRTVRTAFKMKIRPQNANPNRCQICHANEVRSRRNVLCQLSSAFPSAIPCLVSFTTSSVPTPGNCSNCNGGHLGGPSGSALTGPDVPIKLAEPARVSRGSGASVAMGNWARMVERIDKLPDEDDETFLMRAEAAMHLLSQKESSANVDIYTAMDEQLVRDQARALAAAATRAFDKPGAARPIETLRRMVVPVSDGIAPPVDELVDINKRSVLLARSLLRDQQRPATGPDPVGEAAYALLSRFALEIMTDGGSDGD